MSDLWKERFNPDFVKRSHPDWARPDAGEDELWALFLEHGLPRLLPIDEGLDFEPEHFLDLHPEWEGCSDTECYRAWLSDYVDEPASAAAHLRQLRLFLWAYPAGFPWRYYARLNPGAGANRWTALEHFLDHGFRYLGQSLAYGEGAQELLLAIAVRVSERDDRMAMKAFDLAVNYGPLPTESRQHYADACLRMGLNGVAQQMYQALVDEGHAAPWTVRNLGLVAASIGRRSDGVNAVLNTAPALRPDPVWQAGADDMTAGLFQDGLAAARALISQGDLPKARAAVLSAVEQVGALWRARSEPMEAEETRNGADGGPILIFADSDDPLLVHQRIRPRSALFSQAGLDSVVFHKDWRGWEEALPGAGGVIFLQTMASVDALRIIAAARAQAVPTYYEAYSPAFDSRCSPPPLSAYAGFLSQGAHADLTLNVFLHEAMARACDFGVAATDALADRLKPLVAKTQAWTLADGLAEANPEAPIVAHGDQSPVLFLESFRFLALAPGDGGLGEALFEGLSKHPHLRLAVSGYVRLDPAFDVFGDRIAEHGLPSAPGAGLATLAGRPINIAVTVDPCDDAASSASWLHAAFWSIPSIVDPEAASAAGLKDGRHALVATEKTGWLAQLDRLVADVGLWSRIGADAQKKATADRSPKALSRSIETIFHGGKAPVFKWPTITIGSPRFSRS